LSATEELSTAGHDDPPMPGSCPSQRGRYGERPVVRVKTPVGDDGWLVTRHSEICTLLLDPRLGRTHLDPDNAPEYVHNPMLERWRSADFATEHEARAQMRAGLTPYFSGRSINVLRPRVAAIVDEAVARFTAQAPPAEVHWQFSRPLSAQILGELLGAPRADQAIFPGLVHQLADMADAQNAQSGQDALGRYLYQLVARKRVEPGEDVLSGMIGTGSSDDECVTLGFLLLIAGFGGTANHTSMAIAKIAGDAVLRDRLVADPALIRPAVEEFLRVNTSGTSIFPHYAREDIEIADVTIRAGDLVLIDYALGNSDERTFPAPDEVDITRLPNSHLTFAIGLWRCPGAPLARMHLNMVLTALLAAVPKLRLAKPQQEMAAFETGHLGGGLLDLQVTW
jgi:cytochrome P450 monooxygenase